MPCRALKSAFFPLAALQALKRKKMYVLLLGVWPWPWLVAVLVVTVLEFEWMCLPPLFPYRV